MAPRLGGGTVRLENHPGAPNVRTGTGDTGGIDVTELAARLHGQHGSGRLTAGQLESWLVSAALATRDDRGRLHLTRHGRRLAGDAGVLGEEPPRSPGTPRYPARRIR